MNNAQVDEACSEHYNLLASLTESIRESDSV